MTAVVLTMCFSPIVFAQAASDGPPNVIIVLADQWSAQAIGYAGDPNLAQNDAALNPESWTGHTGCIILAPHLKTLKKKDFL